MKSSHKIIKESNPEALYYQQSPIDLSKVNIFGPRGEHAQDAYDQYLNEMLDDMLPNDNYDFEL